MDKSKIDFTFVLGVISFPNSQIFVELKLELANLPEMNPDWKHCFQHRCMVSCRDFELERRQSGPV